VGRRSTQFVPFIPPAEPELRWGAEVYEKKGGFMPYGPRTCLYVYSSDAPLLDRLLKTFGGRVVPISATHRWMLYGELLEQFIRQIRPFLSETGVKRTALVEEVLATERAKINVVQEKHLLRAIAEYNVQTGPAGSTPEAQALPEMDPSEVEINGRIPDGPWDESEPILQAAKEAPEGLRLRAPSVTTAEGFIRLAQSVGLLADAVRVSGHIIVRLAAPPSAE
jgi:hypothetical protein